MKPIRICTNDRCREEKDYLFDVVFNQYLGLPYELDFTLSAHETRLSTIDGEITFPDIFFGIAARSWLDKSLLPNPNMGCLKPLPEYDIFSPGEDISYFTWGDDKRFDPFGNIFFCISRIEESITQPDNSARFPYAASTLGKMLKKPIVNYWIEAMWSQVPGRERYQRRKNEFRPEITHDVDNLSSNLGRAGAKSLKIIAGDVLKRRDIGLARRRTLAMVSECFGLGSFRDPIANIENLSSIYRQQGISAKFYFMCMLQEDVIAYRYDVGCHKPLIGKLIEDGHEIGIHPYFDTFKNPERLSEQLIYLNAVLSEYNVEAIGGRQHGLEWVPETWRHWSSVGLKYDSSVYFAEEAGFRSGCCFDHSTYDVIKRRKLPLIERPLVLMDTTFESYKSVGQEEKQSEVGALISECRKFGGTFRVLFHNCKLISEKQKRFFKWTLNEAGLEFSWL
ncbi:MAG: hypothetical protein ACI9P7_000559 [Candidatus Azotimanducaceae bacterium]|jgi:hypothetical protein